MSYTKIVIEDLNAYESINKDSASQLAGRALIEKEHKQSELIPRDPSVWSKTPLEKQLLKKYKSKK